LHEKKDAVWVSLIALGLMIGVYGAGLQRGFRSVNQMEVRPEVAWGDQRVRRP